LLIFYTAQMLSTARPRGPSTAIITTTPKAAIIVTMIPADDQKPFLRKSDGLIKTKATYNHRAKANASS